MRPEGRSTARQSSRKRPRVEQGQIMHETATIRRRIYHWQLVAAGITAVMACAPSVAEVDHEFLFFPSIDGLDTFSESDPSVRDSYIHASLDLLYSVSGNRVRFLGEFLWSSEEAEIERLQAGYRVGDDTFVWGGRFHAPAKIWTSEFHHGQYLQTSITRPALEEWEDDGGSNPSHITGLLLESERQRDDESAIGVAASTGVDSDDLLAWLARPPWTVPVVATVFLAVMLLGVATLLTAALSVRQWHMIWQETKI